MKKVYLLGVVLSLGLSAVAAPNVAVKQAKYSAVNANTEVFSGKEPIGNGIAINTPAMAKAPAKAVSSTDDLLGLKKWSGIRMFSQKEYITESGTLIINGPQEGVAFASDARPTRITLLNFPATGLNLRLEIDLDKKEAYIPNETFVGTSESADEKGNPVNYEVNIYTRKINADVIYDESDDLYKYSDGTTECEEAVGKILDDGTISFEGYTLMASSPGMYEQGSLFLMLNTANLKIETTPFNTPNEAEYNYVGKGEYMDPVLKPLFEDEMNLVPVNKNVDIYVKGDDEGILIAVKNPYKEVAGEPMEGQNGQMIEITDFWKQVGFMYEDANEDGWLLFKVFTKGEFADYSNVAAQLQLVPCGMELDQSEDQDGSDVQMLYPFNEEGAIYTEGGEDALLELLEKYELSKTEWSDVVDNTLYIRNTYFGMGTSPDAGYWWQHEVNGNYVYRPRVVGYVTLPEGWLEAGVNSVISDNENAPVKYYNLQGIELKTPVKGQLTIRKQGNKSTKFIAR